MSSAGLTWVRPSGNSTRNWRRTVWIFATWRIAGGNWKRLASSNAGLRCASCRRPIWQRWIHLQLWDVQTARLVAIKERECQVDRDLVVLGAVDMPQTLRQMLGQVAERVTVLVHAPEEWADRFDDDGCLVPEAWPAVRIPLDADRVHLVDGPTEVADMVARSLAAWDGRYRADEITIGLADEKITPYVSRQLQECGIAARPAVGKSSSETAPYRLLSAIEAYLRSGRYGEFAALVRHPDMSAWIDVGKVAAGWLERLDDYYSSHLQARLSEDWLGDDARARPVRQVVERVEILLAPFSGDARPWDQWNEAVRKLLLQVYGDRAWDRQRRAGPCLLGGFRADSRGAGVRGNPAPGAHAHGRRGDGHPIDLAADPHRHRLVAVRSGSDRVAGLAGTAAGRRFRAGRVQL